MSDEIKQITDLTSGSITNDNDVFVMDTYEGITVKIPYSALRTAIANAITPSINSTSKHWYIGSTDTGVVAEGQDGAPGATGATGANGADGVSISASETAITNGYRVTISSTDPNVSDVTFDLTNGTNGTNGANGADGDDGASISATETPIIGGHTVTIHSTDPNVSDVSFNVMDGNAGGYGGINGITVAGNDIAFNAGSGLQYNSSTGNVDVVGKQAQITTSAVLTLTVAGWNSSTKQQTVTFVHDTTKRNIIDITLVENADWDSCKVYPVSETTTGITFECDEIPETALTFRVTSMEVS